MPPPWKLLVHEELRPDIIKGVKNIDIRLGTSKNARLIGEILRYQPADELEIGFNRSTQPSVQTIVTQPSEIRSLGSLTSEEVRRIAGDRASTAERLAQLLSGLYGGRTIDAKTRAYLIHFALKNQGEP